MDAFFCEAFRLFCLQFYTESHNYNRGVIHGYESCLAVAEKWFGKKSKVYKSLKKDFEKMIKSDYDIDV